MPTSAWRLLRYSVASISTTIKPCKIVLDLTTMESLPSHRQIITSLICSISTIAPSTTDDTSSKQPSRAGQPSTLSPSQAFSPSQRPLLLTLHVLFPNLVLPALDLLDRKLVTRLVRNQELQNDSSSGTVNDVFLVRSLGTTLSRRTRDYSLSSKRYIVHLNAWNCSCASFTLDAFTGHRATATGQAEQLPPLREVSPYGGLSLDWGGDAPSCCKHLLACLLADRWSAMIGMYVEDRVTSREDLAGIVADI